MTLVHKHIAAISNLTDKGGLKRVLLRFVALLFSTLTGFLGSLLSFLTALRIALIHLRIGQHNIVKTVKGIVKALAIYHALHYFLLGGVAHSAVHKIALLVKHLTRTLIAHILAKLILLRIDIAVHDEGA